MQSQTESFGWVLPEVHCHSHVIYLASKLNKQHELELVSLVWPLYGAKKYQVIILYYVMLYYIWDVVVKGYVLCLSIGGSRVRFYIKPLCSDRGQVAHL